MKKLILLYIILISFLISCKDKTEHFTIPDYKGWKRPYDQVLDAQIPGHGATFRLIYANEIAFNSKIVKESSGSRVSMDDGSMIVKEVYDKREDIGSKTPALYIMVKESKDPDADNGWVYYVKKPGQDTVEVKGRMCAGCHVAANEKHPYFDGNKSEMFRDYLFALIAR
jgi:hypothetical protein